MKRIGLFLLLGGAGVIAAACSSGGGSGEGRILGTVVDDGTGAGIADAEVRVGTANTESDTSGEFTVRVEAGERPVRASAPLYRILNTDVMITGGDNTLKLRLVPCNPATDIDCATPVPSPTAATPTPTPNIIAAYDGVNLRNTGDPPQNWTGTASVLLGGTPLIIGDDLGSNDYAFSECWRDSNENTRNVTGDTRDMVDHCSTYWFGESDGPGNVDVLVRLTVVHQGTNFWSDGTLLTVTPGTVVLGYYLGTRTGGTEPFFNVDTAYIATSGSIYLEAAGYFNDLSGNPPPVVLTSGAFLVPGLP